MTANAINTTAARPRLRVVEAEARPQQDCTRCRLLQTCWDPRLKPDGVVVNLLVCRLKRGIDRDRSARTLVRLIENKARKVAQWLRSKTRGSDGPIRTYVADIQAVAIQSLTDEYLLGSRLHPIRWLFGKPNGAITSWARNRIRVVRSEHSKLIHYDSRLPLRDRNASHTDDINNKLTRANVVATNRRFQSGPPDIVHEPLEYDPGAADRDRAGRVIATLDDGVSLSVDEYRVLAFCFANAHSNGRHATDGLHLTLAQKIGTSRNGVTRTYAEGLRKLLDASGEATRFLSARGIALPYFAARRRRTVEPTPRATMSAEEITEMLALREEKSVPLQDLAWIYGVTEYFIRRVIDRFQGLSPDEIRRFCHR